MENVFTFFFNGDYECLVLILKREKNKIIVPYVYQIVVKITIQIAVAFYEKKLHSFCWVLALKSLHCKRKNRQSWGFRTDFEVSERGFPCGLQHSVPDFFLENRFSDILRNVRDIP